MEQALFRALGDPTRRAVYERLAAGEMNVAGLTALLDVTQPAVSQHLAALKGAGLVSERREGRRTYYKAEPAGLDPLMDWMAHTGAWWQERIERLRNLLKGMDR